MSERTYIPLDCVSLVEEVHKAEEELREVFRASASMSPEYKQQELNVESAMNALFESRKGLARELLRAGLRVKVAWRIAFEGDE